MCHTNLSFLCGAPERGDSDELENSEPQMPGGHTDNGHWWPHHSPSLFPSEQTPGIGRPTGDLVQTFGLQTKCLQEIKSSRTRIPTAILRANPWPHVTTAQWGYALHKVSGIKSH